MAAKSQYLNNKVLGAVLTNVSYTGGVTLYVALNTTASTPTVPGTEVTTVASNYARQPVTSATGWTPTPPTASTVNNTGLLSFFGAGAASGPFTLNEIAIYDAVTAGNELYYGAITGAPKTVNNGDTASIAIGALVVTES